MPSLEKQHDLLKTQLLDSEESTIEFMYIPLQLNNNPEDEATDMMTLFSKRRDGNYITVVAMLMHTFSRGSVHITSADVEAQPHVEPQYLAHHLDGEMLARTLLFIERQIAVTEPLASLLKNDGRRIPPLQRPEEAGSHGVEKSKVLEEARKITR